MLAINFATKSTFCLPQPKTPLYPHLAGPPIHFRTQNYGSQSYNTFVTVFMPVFKGLPWLLSVRKWTWVQT